MIQITNKLLDFDLAVEMATLIKSMVCSGELY